jgi:hypothetical protein
MDTTNDGPGRWRLCLTTPTIATIEGSAWCRWDAARTRVDEVTGLPTPAGALGYDAWLSFPAAAFEVHLTDQAHDGLIANYAPPTGLPSVTTDDAHTNGGLPVDVALVTDEEAPGPTGAPPGVSGQFVWSCGDPPAAV